MRRRRTKGSGYAYHDGVSWTAAYRDKDGISRKPRFKSEAEAFAHLDQYAPVKNVSPTNTFTKEELFWSYVDKASDCWNWQGARYGTGYGHFQWSGKSAVASRIAYELTHGAIPDGCYICHTCDNKLCCRPDHLFAGTPSENTLDSVRKGRWGNRATKRERKRNEKGQYQS